MIISLRRYVSGRPSADRDVEVALLDTYSHSFELSPLDVTLRDDEIHIWFSVLAHTQTELYKFLQTLSSKERMRAERFLNYEDKKRFIARHGILRMILGSYLNVEPSELLFYHGEHGKPAIAETSGKRAIHFNLSHSNGVALFAFSRNYEIGVDIEHMREIDISEIEQIVERFFSLRENDAFRSLPDSQKREAFYNGWTRKEAFVKALGDGLSRPLDQFELSLFPGEPAKLLRIKGDPREASKWSIQNLKPAPDYIGAFAIRSHLFA